MRIAYFSPLPPAASGIADYSAELLPHLGRHGDITLFVNPDAPLDDTLASAFPVCDWASFAQRREEFDVVLYHMGNNVAYHEHIYWTLQATPGIVVLHETVFYHFFRELTVARDDSRAFLYVLERVYGRADAERAVMEMDEWRRNRYAFPSLSPILSNALGAIVHSQYARRQVQRCRPDLPVAVVPHHLSLPAPFDEEMDREAIRRDLNLDGRLVVGSFGFITEAKRPAVLLRAFARFHRDHPEAVCCLVGGVSPAVGLAAHGPLASANLDLLGLPEDAVRLTGRVPMDDFLHYMVATDIAVNLRYPTSGETSGSVTRLLGLGVPTIVSDVGAFSELPDDVCAKVPVDAWEEDTIVALLEALSADEELRRAIGANARRHTHHTPEGSAQAYASFIQQIVTRLHAPPEGDPAFPEDQRVKARQTGEAETAGPPAISPMAEVISDIGGLLAGWGITEHHDPLLHPIAQTLAELGNLPKPAAMTPTRKAHTERSRSRSLSPAERVFLCIFVSLVVSAGLATFLAELGILSLVSLLAGLILTGLALWRLEGREWKMDSNLQSPPSLWALGLMAVLILAAALFFRPAESILVMDDAGVYVIHGLTLARTGGLAIRDPLLPSLSPAAAEQLLPLVVYESSYIRHEGAFYIWQWGGGLVQPAFFHLPSIWMAVLALVAGPRAALWAAPLAGLVAVGGFALLSRRLFGPAVGLAAALLLTLSFPEVWFARYPTSEIFMQAWLLGGLFLLAVFLQHRPRFIGVAAGVSLGQLLLIRVDAWIAVAAIGLCFAGWYLADRRPPSPQFRGVRGPAEAGDRWFLMPLTLTLAYAGLHAALFATPYVVSLMHLYLTPRLGATVALGVAISVSATLVLWCRPGALNATRRHVGRLIKSPFKSWILGIVVIGGALLATLMSPRVGVARSAESFEAVRWLSWYMTPLGLAAALFGLLLTVRQGLSRPVQVVLVLALLYAVLYLPAPRVRPVQPWGVRRFVPVVLPALILGMAYLAARFPAPGPERLRQAVRLGLVVILAGVLARGTWPILAHDEYAGVWNQVEALAGRFEPGTVVLFNPTGVGQAVAQPLTYLYDRPAFVLQAEEPDLQVIQELVSRWSGDGRPVYLAVTGLLPWLADASTGLSTSLDMRVEPAGSFTFRFPVLERPTTYAPRNLRTMIWPIELYQLESGGGRKPVSRLEMEPGELSYLRKGFYEPERAPDSTTFRWTDGAAQLSLPVSQGVAGLTLRVSGPPAQAPRPTLRVFVDGREMGTWELSDRFTILRIDVPAGAATDGRLDILLESDTWVPKLAGLGDDQRRLGVIVDWIAIQ